MKVGGTCVGVAVSTGVCVLDGLGTRVGVGIGVGVGVDSRPQPTSTTPDKTIPTAKQMVRCNAQTLRWDRVGDDGSLTRITFPLCSV